MDITQEQLLETVDLMRKIGVDLQKYEVKSTPKEASKDIAKTLSAFSNGSGGWLIFGLSEKDGFAPVKDIDIKSLQDSIANICNEKMHPPVRPIISVHEIEGYPILVADIKEMRPMDKPCYVKQNGMYDGAFIRTGDGDRRLSHYEVDRLNDEHRQPRYDRDIVEDATIEDLDDSLLAALLQRERIVHARNFAQLPDEEALIKLNVIKKDAHGILRPTLAGLLALGGFPQQFFPRLNISFACYPGTNKSDVTEMGQRLIDSATLVGSVPFMIEDAIAAIDRNMRTGALIEGAFRKDVPDYPIVALREAIANALMHRDYSPQSHGTPVQIDMYIDRLEILNPGGLFGNVTIDMLGKDCVSASRNQFLANLLESIPYSDGQFVAENRGTGYQTIEAQMSDALMPPPTPKDTIGFFSLLFQKRHITPDERRFSSQESMRAIILGLLEDQGSISTGEVAKHSGKSKATVVKYINGMIEANVLEPTQPKGSTKQRYRLSH